MILPSKHVPPSRSLLGIGAFLLHHLERERTLASLWDAVRAVPEVASFERFTLALDLLFALGAVTLDRGLLRRGSPRARLALDLEPPGTP